MSYRVGYTKKGEKTFLSIAAATKGELARGLKEVCKAWGEKLDFPKFLKIGAEFTTAISV